MMDADAAANAKTERTERVERDPNRPGFWRFRNIAAMALLPLLGFVGKTIWGEFESMTKTIRELETRLHDVERDRANNQAIWSALAEAKNKITDMEVRNEASVLYLNWIADRMWPKMTTLTPESVKPPPITAPPIWPTPANTTPQDFRSQFEQRYPLEQKKK